MASYHFEAKIIGRSDGRSVVAAAAYRAGERIEREETGDQPDYRRKGGVVSADLLTPDNAPDWAQDRAQLWNAVEAREMRKNSQLAREITVALPHELTETQARALVLEWAQTELVSQGMVVDVCMHNPKKDGESYNTHAHLLCTQRGLDPSRPDGWSKGKNRAWNDARLLEKWRETWAEAQNRALEAAGCDARVDHRSLEDQREAAVEVGDTDAAEALDRPPEPRMGVAATAMEDKARRSAARRGEAYEPVTELGQRVAESRGLRAALSSAMSRLRGAIRDLTVAKAAMAVDDPVSAPEPDELETMPELPAPEDPPEDTDDGPSLGM